MLPATTPAQEFGEWTRLSDERSTTCGNGGIAPRHHARPECSLTEEYASLRPSPRSLTRHVNLLLFATTTGSRHVFTRVRLGTHPCSRTRRREVVGCTGCVGCVGWGEGDRGWKSTSPCHILLPLLSADYRPGLLSRPTPDAHASLLKNLDSRLLLRATASPG